MEVLQDTNVTRDTLRVATGQLFVKTTGTGQNQALFAQSRVHCR